MTRSALKNSLKVALLLGLVVGMGAALLVVVVSGGHLNDWLERRVSGSLSEALSATVTIDRIEGNPFRRLVLHATEIRYEDESLAAVDRIDIVWQPERLLLWRLTIDTIRVRGAGLQLRQDKDGVWSVPPAAASEGVSSSIPAPRIVVGALDVEGVDVTAYTVSDTLRVRDLGFLVRATIGDRMALSLSRFRTQIFDPPIAIDDISGAGSSDGTSIVLDRLSVRSTGVEAEVSGTMDLQPELRYRGEVHVISKDLADIGRATGTDLPSGGLTAGTRIRGTADSLSLDADVMLGRLAVDVVGGAHFGGARPRYRVNLSARNLEMQDLFPGSSLDAGFDLDVGLSGSGIDLEGLTGEVSGRLHRAHVLGSALQASSFDGSFDRGKGQLRLSTTGPAGHVSAGLRADLRGDIPLIDLTVDLASFDASRIPHGTAASTDLSGRLRLLRTGRDAWAGSATIRPARVGEFSADRVSVRGVFDAGRVRLDSLAVRSATADLSGSGVLDLGGLWTPDGGEPAYTLNLALEGVEPDSLFGFPILSGSIETRAAITGTGFQPDSAQAQLALTASRSWAPGQNAEVASAEARYDAGHVVLDTLRIDLPHATVRASGSGRVDGALDVRASVILNTITEVASGLGIDVDAAPLHAEVVLSGTVAEPALSGVLRTDRAEIGGVQMVGLSGSLADVVLSPRQTGRMQLRAERVQAGEYTAADVSVGLSVEPDSRISIRILTGTGGDLGLTASVEVQVDSSGAARVAAEPVLVRLGDLVFASEGSLEAELSATGGLVGARGTLRGQAGSLVVSSPRTSVVAARLESVDLGLLARFAGLVAPEIEGRLDARVSADLSRETPRVEVDFSVQQGSVARIRYAAIDGRAVADSGWVNGEIRLTQSPGRVLDASWKFSALEPGESRFRLASGGIDLAFLQLVSADISAARGTLSLELSGEGDPSRPRLLGWARIQDGSAKLASLNQEFSRIAAEIVFEEDRVDLRKLEVGQKKGLLKILGHASLKDDEIIAFRAELNALDFQAVNRADLNAVFRGRLLLEGSPSAPRLTGQVEFTRAVITIPERLAPTDPAPPSEFVRALQTNVRILARKNVWVRSKSLNLELQGDLDAIKEGETVRLYGTLSSRRGRYTFQGTQFDIDRGEIAFVGKETPDPDLSIVATYRTRQAEGEPLAISVLVGGTLLYPQITLESDPPMPMPDILSFLLIGRPADQGGGSLSAEDRAAGLVVGLAASRLKQTVGRRLNLDVVEIEAGSSGISRVRVGKYVGSRLFISYTTDSREVGHELLVEYELTPNLVLEGQQRQVGEQRREQQAVGVFWKTEW